MFHSRTGGLTDDVRRLICGFRPAFLPSSQKSVKIRVVSGYFFCCIEGLALMTYIALYLIISQRVVLIVPNTNTMSAVMFILYMSTLLVVLAITAHHNSLSCVCLYDRMTHMR